MRICSRFRVQACFHGYSKQEERMALMQGRSEAYIEGHEAMSRTSPRAWISVGIEVGVVSGSALASNSVKRYH